MDFIKNNPHPEKSNIPDCVCRAITLALELPYKKVYNELIAAGWSLQQNERSGGIFVWLKILARKLKFEFDFCPTAN